MHASFQAIFAVAAATGQRCGMVPSVDVFDDVCAVGSADRPLRRARQDPSSKKKYRLVVGESVRINGCRAAGQ